MSDKVTTQESSTSPSREATTGKVIADQHVVTAPDLGTCDVNIDPEGAIQATTGGITPQTPAEG